MTVNRTRGDDWSGDNAIAGTIKKGGTAVDLTGATIVAQLRKDTEKTDTAATFTVVNVDLDDGEIALTLTDTVTRDLTPGLYVYDIEVTIGSQTVTYGTGSKLRVHADTTRVP